LSYLWLRGRCQCGEQPIGLRYPLVELLVGFLALGLFVTEVLTGGQNLAFRAPDRHAGNWVLWFPRWDLLGIYVMHFTLLYILLAMTLIRGDGLRVPWGLAAIAIGVSLAVSILISEPIAPGGPPSLKPKPGQTSWLDPSPQDGRWQNVLDFGKGVICGAVCGFVLGLAMKGIPRGWGDESWSVFVGMSAIGAALGLASVLPVATLASVLILARWLSARALRVLGRVPAVGILFFAALGMILIQRPLFRMFRWPTSFSPSELFTVQGLSLLVWLLACIFAWWLAERGRRPLVTANKGLTTPLRTTILPYPARASRSSDPDIASDALRGQ
jgi:prepilin signal peptidase PulO-like enzyme (type II secretory pathway)